jgi:multiple sugar transport system permease protein
MSAYLTTAHSVVEPSPTTKRVAAGIVIAYALITMIPLFWIFITGWKTPPDSIAYPPKVVFDPSLEGYCNLFTTRTRQTSEYIQSLGPAATTCDEITRERDMVIAGSSNYAPRFWNSLIIAFGSTFCSVVLGVLAAYGFSRFKVPLKDDLLFFILSTRMMPPIAVAIPIYLLMRDIGAVNGYPGLILPYVALSLPLVIWIMIGFFDEIPREIDDAALVDGCSRASALFYVLLPLARPGMIVAAIFGIIFVWNEFLVGLYVINSTSRETIPIAASGLLTVESPIAWNNAAAVGVLTVIPVLLFSLVAQKYIVRGITAGAVR